MSSDTILGSQKVQTKSLKGKLLWGTEGANSYAESVSEGGPDVLSNRASPADESVSSISST